MKILKEDLLFMIEQATKAPSGHNTQPWLFRINENSIEIHPDSTKTLPVVDSDQREMFVSLGCAAENLCIAAISRGYRPTVSISAKGIITLQPARTATPVEATGLAEQISKRQTNRRVYNGTLIPDETMRELLAVKRAGDTSLHCWPKGSEEFRKLHSYIMQGNEIQMNDLSFKKELKSWMRFNREQVRKTGDGLSYSVFGAPNLPARLSCFIMGSCLTAKRQNSSDRKKIASSSHFILFTAPTNTPEAWIQLGRTLERFLLHATRAGIATAFTNQPCELQVLSDKMQQEIAGLQTRIPVVLLRLGYAAPMPYSPRKEVAKIIITD